ncbi:MAG: beta-N-acetylhexosaminidase [Corallococcus sp.]|nr:beta-N-acetylhexosaminidase [Corallococcus sp.]MCM1359846.1 beta-N-acetylhexosaminidase [Corallococcus sp.]MCM1395280.1 beta-N-acetylhexosaminidase [Corallococcus sp.]
MAILPQPQKYEKLGGDFTVTAETKLYCDDIFSAQGKRLAELIKECSGLTLGFAENITDAQIIFTFNEKCAREESILMISEGLATVTASCENGCYYAVETLRQLLRLDEAQENPTCSNCYVRDNPKFAYRGLSVDICRHFFPLDTLKQIVELMARVKLNKLHLHLSDDQGYRLESKKFPLLNSVSSIRSGSEVIENGVRVVDETEVSGYLSHADVAELVRFAALNQIEVIPEIDVPGHCVAILAAYPDLSCEGGSFEVRKRWGISKDILCAGNDETYNFVTELLDEVCEMFPSEYVHLGGDEAPKDRWCNCKKCREKMAELKLDDYEQLQTYMVENFRAHLESKGKKVICWNDGVTKSASKQIVSQVWKPFTRKDGAKQANRGRQTVMSPFFSMYFDYPYAMTPLKKTYAFNPLKGVKKSRQDNVLGVEGALWTEYIATENKLYFNLLPRMLALAECAWGTNKGNFVKRASNYVTLYDKLGLTYNTQAIKKFGKRNVKTVNEFFKINPDTELETENKSKLNTSENTK